MNDYTYWIWVSSNLQVTDDAAESMDLSSYYIHKGVYVNSQRLPSTWEVLNGTQWDES